MRERFSLTSIIVLLLLLMIGGAVFYLYVFELIIESTELRGLSDIRQIHEDLTEAVPAGVPSSRVYQNIVMTQSRIIRGRILIIDRNSYLLADSDKKNNRITGQFINAELSDAKERDFASSSLHAGRGGHFTVTVAQKKEIESQEIVISVSYQVDEVGKLVAAFISFALYSGILLTILVFLIVSIEVRQYQGPIRKLLKLTSDAARGGISKINVDTGSSELSQLVDNFNSLVERYNTLTESDNKKYSRINTLLSNIKTGILMLDKENAVTLVNHRAEEMLKLNKLSLFKVRDTSSKRNENFEKILDVSRDVNRDKDSVLLTLNTEDGCVFDVSVEAIFSKYKPYEHSGTLVILRDVTEMRRLEQLKDDFVANVSHELRTPLTLINGFVETLKSWELLSRDDRYTALNIIEVETERLKKLISELLLLSRIEGGMTEATRSSIDAPGIISEVVKALEPLRLEKELALNLHIAQGIHPFQGVMSWFRQIVFNLYHNSLKYTPEKGHIEISLIEENQNLILSVSDDGIGIPFDEKEKIFNRFYRIEKYKNRKISGSGLGLTITKHMVIELGGTIDLNSEEGRGSVFKVTLPSRHQDQISTREQEYE